MNVRHVAPRGPVRLSLLMLACLLTLLVTACGRVNLEDLTPEAVRTQQAMVTPTSVPPTPAPGETPGTGGSSAPVDLLAGGSLYNNYCSGCHDNGRAGAQPLKGREGLDPTAAANTVRNGVTAAGGAHNAYTTTELTDQQILDILAFIAQ